HCYFLHSTKGRLTHLPLSARKLYQSIDENDNPMLNSGLFLANANIGTKTTTNSIDDGIITAYEISELDFSNIDMMVLSACETGLGRLSSDGVFGIQRGLKIAGVNSILMTLEKVDDEITCDMMTELYKEYFRGISKKDAFETAKEKIRIKYPNNRCWASFILLDAI
ncbi:MAG: CHAT domain-containing protein, partial [Muribaculaceae bacterium]|nr:CHAT domain-containing protein [Muribaculaceae bacterium]